MCGFVGPIDYYVPSDLSFTMKCMARISVGRIVCLGVVPVGPVMRTVSFVRGAVPLHRSSSDRIVSDVVSTDEPVDAIVRASGSNGIGNDPVRRPTQTKLFSVRRPDPD